jgi:hypothetical protein
MFDDDYTTDNTTTDHDSDTTDNSDNGESKEHTVYDDRVRDGQ